MREIAFGYNLVLLLFLQQVFGTAVVFALGHSSNPWGWLLSYDPKLCVSERVCFVYFLSTKENSYLQSQVEGLFNL